jgi:hypothetical protein
MAQLAHAFQIQSGSTATTGVRAKICKQILYGHQASGNSGFWELRNQGPRRQLSKQNKSRHAVKRDG